MNDWNRPESWKTITCIMIICAGHQNKEIYFAAQCSLNTGKQPGMNWRIAMGITRPFLEENNIRDKLIAFVQQNSSKICRKK